MTEQVVYDPEGNEFQIDEDGCAWPITQDYDYGEDDHDYTDAQDAGTTDDVAAAAETTAQQGNM